MMFSMADAIYLWRIRPPMPGGGGGGSWFGKLRLMATTHDGRRLMSPNIIFQYFCYPLLPHRDNPMKRIQIPGWRNWGCRWWRSYHPARQVSDNQCACDINREMVQPYGVHGLSCSLSGTFHLRMPWIFTGGPK